MSLSRFISIAASAFLLASALAACGGGAGGADPNTGGGGTGGVSPPPPTPSLVWAQEAYLKAANAGTDGFGTFGDAYGSSIAISGDTIVVGAPREASSQTTITNGPAASADNSAPLAGAAYVYRRTGNTWVQEAYLKAPNARAGDEFGYSVAISGDTVVVGARKEASNQTTITNGPSASANQSAGGAGAVYVFKRTGNIWVQEAYLKAFNAEGAIFVDYFNQTYGDQFGSIVAVNGDTVVVGAPLEQSSQTTIANDPTVPTNNAGRRVGAAYVFKRTGANWAFEAYLKAPNAHSDNLFGTSVAVSGDTVVVGAPYENSNQTTVTNGTTASADNSANSAGAAYVYRRTGNAWAQEAYLKASNTDAGDGFGASVAISGDTVAVGAPYEDSNQSSVGNGTTASADNSAGNAGAAYVYRRTANTWVQEAYLKAPNAGADDNFGYAVAISGDTVAVGTPGEDSNQGTISNSTTASADNSASNAGAANVFKRSGSNWAHTAYLKAPNVEAGDNFGWSVAISGDTVSAGAVWEDSNQTTVTNGTTASADNTAPGAGAAYALRLK